jgi:hypothetical protein
MSTLAIANRELPAYQVDKSAVSGKSCKVVLTENATISANTPNRVRINTRSAENSGTVTQSKRPNWPNPIDLKIRRAKTTMKAAAASQRRRNMVRSKKKRGGEIVTQ